MVFRFLAEWKSWITAWDTLKCPWTLGFMILRSRELIADLLRRTSPAFGRGAVGSLMSGTDLSPGSSPSERHDWDWSSSGSVGSYGARSSSLSTDKSIVWRGNFEFMLGVAKASCLFNPFSPWGVATGRCSWPGSRRVSSAGTSSPQNAGNKAVK